MIRNLKTSYNQVLHNVDAMEEVEESKQLVIYSAITSDPGEPTTFEEAWYGPEKDRWRPAIFKEIQNFIQKKVWKRMMQLHLRF